jgi:hypothetical protein
VFDVGCRSRPWWIGLDHAIVDHLLRDGAFRGIANMRY